MEQKSKITEYRADKGGMSLEKFGLLFTPPVDKSTVMRWELGKITPRRAVEIEAVTGIRRHELLPEFFQSAGASAR